MQARTNKSDGSHTRYYWYVAGVIAVLVVLVSVALLVGGALLGAKPKPAEAPPNSAAANRLGYFRQRLPDGRTCRYVVFDNRVGQAVKDRVDRCEDFAPPPSGAKASASDIDTQPPKFSWGGQDGSAPGSKD